ncbi:hypothetical protein [Streptomyces lasiicapitis]|uniref:hypothetical protein n=1 Tax=Streptomyces lasiicapitis TaxID=1923961 RepID=UPI0016650F10|nr:hypothetical protein [Streptomyces lasiicapitis]
MRGQFWVGGLPDVADIPTDSSSCAVVGVITQVLLFVLGILSTLTAVRMTNALNRKAEAARKEVLGDL